MLTYTATENISTINCLKLSVLWSSAARGQTSNMVLKGAVILSLVVTHVLSAPSRCIEPCNYYTRHYGSQSSGSHADLMQTASQLQGLDFSRPGTWSEHNDYNLDNGHGKVHEEHGQYVEGPKTVKYYKKNYSSSYSTGYSDGAGSLNSEHQNSNYRHGTYDVPTTDEQFLNSQRTYGQTGNSESTAQQEYNRKQSQYMQSTVRRTNAQSERLEDFGEYNGNTQAVQGTDFNTQTSQAPHYPETQLGNWSKVDSYKTDGGHGRVFEEEGQYLSGAKKVRYYKRNYTSGYSSPSAIPIPEVANTAVHDLQKEVDKFHREIGREFNQVSSIGSAASRNIINSDTYSGQVNHGSTLSTNIGSEPNRNPSQNTYGSKSFSMYERHEGHVTRYQPTAQYINPTSGYTSVLNTGNSGYNRHTFTEGSMQQHADNQQQTELLDTHQSRLTQNQMLDENLRRNTYNQNSAIYSGTPGGIQRYNEHWSSSHTRESSVPEYPIDVSRINEQSAQHNSNQYGKSLHNVQQSSYSQQYRENNYNSAHQTKSGKLVTGTLNSGHIGDTVDCGDDTTGQVQSTYKGKYKRSAKHDQLSEIQQQTGGFDDLQQTSGKLELEQQSEDFTQQTGEFDDLTKQTSGKLEFGQQPQHSYEHWKPGTHNQQPEDLTQQTSGILEFGQQSQHSYQPWKPNTGDQQSEDLTQQTGEFDDLTQQTSGKLEFGQQSQHSYQPWKPNTGDQQSEDLTQQTGEFDDLTQQTSGKLEFGQQSQHSYQPWKPNTGDQQSEDLTQQTGEFDDLTQQTSGKLEFGQQSQHSYQPRKPKTGDQQSEDLTQQTGEFDDLTQQTSGKLEFGQQSQHSYQPWKPNTGDQQSEDLTQQTGEFDDLTQQTSGKLEFGQQSQHSYQPRKPKTGDQQSEDLTQQTGEFDDLTQQTSGKLEFGQQSQHSYQPWKPNTGDQQSEDLTQQTGEFDDLTQQTSGKLEFGQQSQHSYQPWKPKTGDQESKDLTQQTGEFDDLTQQTSGKLEFGQQSQHSYQPWKPKTGDQESKDLTQQTGEFDDLTQQTSGKLELVQQSQHSYQPWKPNTGDQQSEDLTQQTGEFDDLTQQTSGKLELVQQSQHSYQPWKPNTGDQQSEDLTQQTGEFDDFTQQTSGKLEFGQQSQHSYQPWKPSTQEQQSEDLTQEANKFDLQQQTSGRVELGNEGYNLHQNSVQKNDDLSQMGKVNQDREQQRPDAHFPKPVEKPKPRPRYSRIGTLHNVQVHDQKQSTMQGHNSKDNEEVVSNVGKLSAINIQELPPYIESEADMGNMSGQSGRGDQSSENSTDTNTFRKLNQQTASNVFGYTGQHADQTNWIHKSNDATVGSLWHYTYHPGDKRQLVQQTYPKDKDSLQQQSSHIEPPHEHSLDQQETQNKYSTQDEYQQSEDYFHGQKTEFNQDELHDSQKQSKLELSQQTMDKIESGQKHVESSEIIDKLEPRILEAYGGGPYEASHSDDIYRGVTINPSATLPPINNADPWDIREKPREIDAVVEEVTTEPSPVIPLSPESETTPVPSFWARVSHKLTNTLDKAKEKAKIIFG